MIGTCPECDFRAIDSVDGTIRFVEEAINHLVDTTSINTEAPSSDGWSASQYVWHLVDVLRFGTERIVAMSVDGHGEAMPWDADEMMAVRRRSPHSVIVGLRTLLETSKSWVSVAEHAPTEGSVRHPELGVLTLLGSLTRNAHEVAHHTYDIERLNEARSGSAV